MSKRKLDQRVEIAQLQLAKVKRQLVRLELQERRDQRRARSVKEVFERARGILLAQNGRPRPVSIYSLAVVSLVADSSAKPHVCVWRKYHPFIMTELCKEGFHVVMGKKQDPDRVYPTHRPELSGDDLLEAVAGIVGRFYAVVVTMPDPLGDQGTVADYGNAAVFNPKAPFGLLPDAKLVDCDTLQAAIVDAVGEGGTSYVFTGPQLHWSCDRASAGFVRFDAFSVMVGGAFLTRHSNVLIRVNWPTSKEYETGRPNYLQYDVVSGGVGLMGCNGNQALGVFVDEFFITNEPLVMLQP